MEWSTNFAESFAGVGHAVLAHLPRMLAALVVLALGWLAGRLFRALTARLVRRLGRSGAGKAILTELRASGMERLAPRLVGGIVFWVVVFFFFAAAVEIAGLSVVTSSLGRLVQYLPSVFAGLLVVLAGIVLGNLARRGVAHAVARAGLTHGELLGKLSRVAILLVAGVIALDQIGIESALLIITLAIVFGTILGGAALAFGLGARATVEGFIAAHYVGQRYRPGDRVRVGGTEGRIVELTRTGVVLDTPEGRALVPAAEFDRSTSILLTGGGAP